MNATALANTILTAVEERDGGGEFAINLDVWKWVIIIGVAAIVVIYAVRRIAEIVVKRKTRTIIREVVGDSTDGEGERGWDDLKKLDRELDE